ncbi:hypothetical protein H4Q26_016800 [Puccinia striiformis f. sp. tritici PST-130]|nr:hypothetical protein H4Q26_016800 [Puccinia striiformis f. sp. tritici PST-130]
MLENEQWKEATGCISDVAQDRSVNFRNSTTQLTGFWSVSNAEALMWLGEKILARKETNQKSSWYSHITEPWRHVWTDALIAYIEGDFPRAYYLSKRGLGLKSDSGKFQKLLHKIAIDYQPAPQTLYEIIGVNKTATTRQIQVAYKALALRFHPDKTQSANNQMMSTINYARDVLVDPNQRTEYDSSLN